MNELSDAPAETFAVEPTEPGWYTYSGGNEVMIFHLRAVSPEYAGELSSQNKTRQWTAHFDNGDAGDCAWGYIEQALGVWDLVPLHLPKD